MIANFFATSEIRDWLEANVQVDTQQTQELHGGFSFRLQTGGFDGIETVRFFVAFINKEFLMSQSFQINKVLRKQLEVINKCSSSLQFISWQKINLVLACETLVYFL